MGVSIVGLMLLQAMGLPALVGWRHPDKILLLRPFDEAQISGALKKLNKRALSYRGFTFTLADTHLQDSLAIFVLANIPVDLGSLLHRVVPPACIGACTGESLLSGLAT